MGAGASASIPDDKLANFKEKLLRLEDLNELQRERLLQQMSLELKKINPISDQDKAASKIQALSRKKNTAAAGAEGNMGSGGSLEEVFDAFCKTYRQTTMTNTVFAKFCKDSKLLDANFKKPDIDMVWSKVAGKEKKVGYSFFVKFLEQIAIKKSSDYGTVEAHVLENAKVSSSGTKGESRFYDDKSTWTGAAVQGGPTNDDKVADLADMTNRT